MPALHGAPDTTCFVSKGTAVPALHLWVEEKKVRESAEIMGTCPETVQGQTERGEYGFWRKDRSTWFIRCQDLPDTLGLPTAFVREHLKRKGWRSQREQKDPDGKVWIRPGRT